jgi:type II secretory pathway pseudopilin PulG
MFRRPASTHGWTLLELVTATTILGFLAALGIPPLLRASGGLRLNAAAREICSSLRLARSWAIRQSTNAAIKFRTGADGRVTYALYRDGDGDGVLNRDIDAGVDPEVAAPRPLAHLGNEIHFGFPPGKPPRDPGDPRRRLDRLDDPIRFNASDLASFDPIGGATPGSVYLTDGRDRLAVVRVTGLTGRARVMVYDPIREVWE